MRPVALGLALFVALALPAAAADGTHSIAFTTGSVTQISHIVLVDTEGLTIHELKPGLVGEEGVDRSPSWSPDGTRIAFESDRGATEIYTMNADGTARRRLTFDSGGVNRVDNLEPTWSPDGRLIAWLKQTGPSTARDVWVMSSDGTGQRRLTSGGGSKSAPAWSPDSTRLVYGQQTSTSEVRVLDVATSHIRSLTRTRSWVLPVAAWSPDGTEIALVSGGRLVVVEADGTSRREVRTTTWASSPAWSLDGERIAYVGTRIFPEHRSRPGPATLVDIYVIGADGTGERRLTGSVVDGYVPVPGGSSPVWWPDGSRLFYTSPRSADDQLGKFVMNADGTCEQRFRPGIPLFEPVWRPGADPRLAPLRCVDLRVLASFEQNAVGLGRDARLRVAVENDGNETATGVLVRLTPTRGSSRRLSGEAVCSGGESLECTLPPLGPGQRTEIVLAVSSSTTGSASVIVDAGSEQRESDPVTNRATSWVEVLSCRTVGTSNSDRILGSPRRDTICAREGFDVVRAGAGDDWIHAGPGNDTVTGGLGRDTVLGGGEKDSILVRDGFRDDVSCGGQRDRVVADRLDRVSKDCERVSRRR